MAAQLINQELYRSIFESSSQGILVVDDFGSILHANQAIATLFEYPSEDLVTLKLEMLIPIALGGAQSELQKKYADALKRKSFGKFKLLGLKKGGSHLSLLINLHPTIVNGKELVIVFVTDGTENLLLAHELEVSEEKNRAILQALPDIIVIQDREGTFLEIQSSNNFQFPYPIRQIKGKKISDFISGDLECKHILKTLQQVIRIKKMEIIEVAIPILNRKVDFEARIVPFEKDKVLVVLRDITKSKAIQNVLDTRNRALEVAGNGIVIVDAQDPILPIIYCNKSFTELTGYSYEEVIGINCAFLQNDDRDQVAIRTMVKAIKNQESCRVVLRNYRKNGTLFWNEVSITPLFNEEKKLTHFIGVQNDVTEIIENRKKLERYTEKLEETIEGRTTELKATVEKLVATNQDLKDQMVSTKVAEEKIRTSQAMFTAIAQNFPNGVIIVFNTKFELVYVEGEELDRIALKKSDIEGEKLDQISFFSDKQKLKLKEDIKKTLDGAAISSEVDFQGQSYTVNSTPLFGDHRKIVWALFVYNNVTEQKKIQQNLEASLKIEQELNELKSRFISMASHEFRTPLSAILSSAILIGKQNEAGNEERRLKHVFRIRNNVKNLVIILNDFLSLSRLEEGKIIPVSQHFELIEFSKLVMEEMKTTKKDGQKIVLLTEEPKVYVDLDPKLISHVLINLLSNATKYSKENQKILLEISATTTHVTLTISDKGIGIPIEEQEKLFERFFRATNATNIQGTGLGLHIVKHYVELMDGMVSFTSELGKGTSFKVKLPLKMVKS
ncbi:PAS domain-containing sensor histidine kinase [Cellulophaga sp. Hel_I_12]|uniref:PAS domain-containing sensor histidine kinase n=1 Tax=Cellulophaga sp. Hel_I_12 TaxID=1249972 RepID=UPI00068EFCCD|nr:PAS domain-containing sensor histidine kinase [Cellulophaga sp. Hel_I_12]